MIYLTKVRTLALADVLAFMSRIKHRDCDMEWSITINSQGHFYLEANHRTVVQEPFERIHLWRAPTIEKTLKDYGYTTPSLPILSDQSDPWRKALFNLVGIPLEWIAICSSYQDRRGYELGRVDIQSSLRSQYTEKPLRHERKVIPEWCRESMTVEEQAAEEMEMPHSSLDEALLFASKSMRQDCIGSLKSLIEMLSNDPE